MNNSFVSSLSRPLALASVAWVAAACVGGTTKELSLGRNDAAAGDSDADRMLALAQCGACHALPEAANGMAPRSLAPDLASLDERMDAGALAAYLADPVALRPRTRMPDVLGSLPESERAAAIERLVGFLLPGEGAARSLAASEGEAVNLHRIEAGRQLYHSTGCVACHGAFEAPEGLEFTLLQFEDPLEVSAAAGALRDFSPGDVWKDAPPLDRLGSLYGVDQLSGFIADPLAARPYGAMPDMGLSPEEARAISEYLLFEDALRSGTVSESTVTGLSFQYFEGDFMEEGPPAFDRLEPLREGTVHDLSVLPEHRPDYFGFRYTGTVEIPADGEWSFWTASDDGSWLWIDGAPVVANGGTHPVREARGRIELSAGLHEIEVRFFEGGGGEALDVHWEGPGVERQTIPSAVLSSRGYRIAARADAARASGSTSAAQNESLRAEGRELFRSLGCASCHPLEGVEPLRNAAPLAELRDAVEAVRGCLSGESARGIPRYPAGLTGEAGALHGAAAAALDGALVLGDEEQLHATLSTMRCTACHERTGVGAPGSDRRKHFRIAADVDLGDEGRVPPQLDLAGWKLRDEWLERVLDQGTKVRPYMLTRMPRFGLENVGHLVELLPTIDRPRSEAEPPLFSKDAVDSGKLLMGIDGLGCVQCHDLAGYTGLGVPAVDLASSHERLRWPWFRALLADPGSLNMNTRMPAFWTEDGRSPVDELYGADPVRQVEAMWSFLSLGDAVPLPKGLVIPEGAYELTPLDEPIAVSVFWEGASARTTLVGFPERLHVAFDVENSRLDTAWRGRFFDARGTWHARAGALERPPVKEGLRLSPGPALAVLEGPDDPWPQEVGRAAGWRARGRTYDEARIPTFIYENEELGGLLVHETAQPRLRNDGVWLQRRFELRAEEPIPSLRMRAGEADELFARGDNDAYVTSSGVRLRVNGAESSLRSVSGRQELLIEIPWTSDATAAFTVELDWSNSQEASR